MNHDASHCLDYVEGKCPMSCFRAKLTRELKFYIEIGRFPEGFITSWGNLKGTEECKLNDDSRIN